MTFHYGGHLSQKFITRDPQLKTTIEREISSFKKTDLRSIFVNLKKRLELINEEKGGHIEHLL